MIDILVQIISDLVGFSYVKSFEIAIEMLTFIVLALTLYWVVEYTRTTKSLDKRAADQIDIMNRQTAEMMKQRDLSMLPSFTHEVPKNNNSAILWVINNVGNGTAVNLKVVLMLPPPSGIGNFSGPLLSSFPHIKPGEGASFRDPEHYITTLKGNDNKNALVLLDDTKPNNKRGATKYTIVYDFQNIEGTCYQQENEVTYHSDGEYDFQLHPPRVKRDPIA